MFFLTLLAISLLACTLAFPLNQERSDTRNVRGIGEMHPSPRLNASISMGGIIPDGTWAGAVLSSPAGTWKTVTATFTVPVPSVPAGESGAHGAAVWVGIDGSSCEDVILQTGVEFDTDGTSVNYQAWYEWFPDVSHTIMDVSVSAGDIITLTVTAMSPNSGVVEFINNSTDESVSFMLSSVYSLCLQDAEWIVEDFEGDGATVPFADFGTVTFTGGSATAFDGSRVGPADAEIYTIQQGQSVLTNVSLGESSVTVSYI